MLPGLRINLYKQRWRPSWKLLLFLWTGRIIQRGRQSAGWLWWRKNYGTLLMALKLLLVGTPIGTQTSSHRGDRTLAEKWWFPVGIHKGHDRDFQWFVGNRRPQFHKRIVLCICFPVCLSASATTVESSVISGGTALMKGSGPSLARARRPLITKWRQIEMRRRDSSSSDSHCIGVMVNHMMSASSGSRMKVLIVDSGATCLLSSVGWTLAEHLVMDAQWKRQDNELLCWR